MTHEDNGHSHTPTAAEKLAAIEAEMIERRTALIDEVRAEISAHEMSAAEHTKAADSLRKQIAGYGGKPKRRAKRTTDRAPAQERVDSRPTREIVLGYFRHNEGNVSASTIAESTGLDRAEVSRELKKLIETGAVTKAGAAKGTTYSAVSP